jgi:hypothetical protein
MLVDIVGFKGVEGAESSWEQVLPRGSPSKLLYALKLIDFLMSDDDEEEGE